MNAGLPGTGIGGLFYILGALWMPVDALCRVAKGHGETVCWPRVMKQFSLGVGVLFALWATGWLLGVLLSLGNVPAAGPTSPLGGEGGVRVIGWGTNVLSWAPLLGGLAILSSLLLSVHLARFLLRPSRGGASRELRGRHPHRATPLASLRRAEEETLAEPLSVLEVG